MRRLTALPCLVLLLALNAFPGSGTWGAEDKEKTPTVPPREGKREKVAIFDGKDLKGWVGHEKYWSVVDGVIIGKNSDPVPVSTYLLTKQKFSDFRFVFDFKLARSEMHSGVAFWGRIAPERGDPYTYAGHLVMFPSDYGFFDLYGRNMIHGNSGRAKKVGKQHDWNTIEVLAQGNRIRFVLNGELISDWREPLPDRIKEAPIGLQLHSNKQPQEVQFKNLSLEAFPEDKLTTLKKVEKKTDSAKAGYQILGHDRGKVSLVDASGKVTWQYSSRADGHDLWMLPGGNVLLATGPAAIAEVSPDKKIVWKYESRPKPDYKGRVEVHAFQRLADGLTMIAESGNRRIIEVDRDGKIVHSVPLTVEHPDAHRDTRMVRKLASGNYLVCHEGDGKVREYDPTGKVVWTYALDLAGRPRAPGHGVEGHGTEVFGAVRLGNGNTLIAGGNNNRVIEVDPSGKTVWSLGHDELPGIRLAWVTTLHVLPSGNVIVGNCHAGPGNPQLFEVTRDKKVVWTFRDFKTFGNGLASAHVLGEQGQVVR